MHVSDNESSNSSRDNTNLFTYQNTDFDELKAFYDGITKKLIVEQKHEIEQVATIE